MENMQKVILEKYLHIGDEVIMQMDPETRGWGRKGVPDGTKGVVVGFYRYINSVAYNERWMGRESGMYEGNGAAYVKWEDGTTDRPSAHALVFANPELNAIRQNEHQYHEAFETMVKLSDLPELPYMEDDVVFLKKALFDSSRTARIRLVNYRDHDKFCDDGITPYPIYDVESMLGNHGTMRVNQNEIESLHKRGNYWAWENDKSKLQFKDLKHEISFYYSLGMTEQVRNPERKNYGWNIDEAIEAIRRGDGDYIEMSPGLFGSARRPLLFRFKTGAEVGDLPARCRTEILNGFNQE